MKKDLLARRKQAEDTFNVLKNSIGLIEAELAKYGMSSLEEAKDELVRLQGEHRLISELLDQAAPVKASSKADVVDATGVDPIKEEEK